jgi:IS30 family transposase
MACYFLIEKEIVMSQERLTVKKIKEILRLKYEAGLSNRAIAGACKTSNSTIGEYLRRAEAAGVGWPLGELSEDELYQKLFGGQEPIPEKAKALPDWEEVRKPVKSHTQTGACRTVRRGKTLVKFIVHQVCGMDRFPRNFL